MITEITERTIARILGYGSAAVALVVLTGTVTDPVNVTKLLVLGGVGGAVFAVILTFGSHRLWNSSKSLVIYCGLLLLAGVSAAVNSEAPLIQNLYGVYGRNTALITYIMLIFVILASAFLRQQSSFVLLIRGLLIAGLINVIYCLSVILFGDFIPWSNPYGNILGTFGNPNFIGAFLGLFASSLVAFACKRGTRFEFRVATGLIFALTVYEIVDSSAIQGRVVVLAGISIVGFYLIRSKFNSIIAQLGYLLVITISGTLALLGALQIGPLTKYIYKTSVSLRGEYWQAGWNMGAGHPFTGVGFDAYGDWYRRARDTQALVMPGPNTVTNAAHNVPFDVFAFGGWPLFICYVLILTLTINAILRITLRTRSYDGVFVTLTAAWVCYQLQSIISINQIGLAIWGWLFGGALIGYEVSTRPRDEGSPREVDLSKRNKKGKHVTKGAVFSPTLIAGIGAVVGLLIASPPYSADAKWRTAISSQNLESVEEALRPTFLNPPNSYKYVAAVQLLESSKLGDQALKYAKIAVEFNPNHFDSWKMLYFISKSSVEDKELALQNMKRLDPNNPNVLG